MRVAAAPAAAAPAIEIELKFQVPAARRQALARAVATASARTTRLQAVYADTSDLRLAAAGLALRLRKEGRVWVQTLKGRGDDLMSRLEHSVRLPAQAGEPAFDPQRHAGSAVGAALAAALQGAAELQPLYRTDIRRLHRRVRSGGAQVEIALDRGHIRAGGRQLAVEEIEFELVSGPPQALVALAARWAARHGLWWDSRTKSERGLRLALDRGPGPVAKAGKAGKAGKAAGAAGAAAALAPGADRHAVWAAALHAALAQALANAGELADDAGTPEHLHQLRVALRRLRSVLRDLGPWSGDAAAARALEQAWRGPFGALGAARDADVIAALGPRLAAAGAPLASAAAAGGCVRGSGGQSAASIHPSAASVDPSAASAHPCAASTHPSPASDRPSPGEVVRGPEFTALLLRSLSLGLAPARVPERTLAGADGPAPAAAAGAGRAPAAA
ncbi:MAG: CYTH domain-containing protein, partial [Burkholderiales bacterium]|nr:CYTH domain-containing protein [Burkholderiales bacterium]